ncbi:hypothetical protein DH2020_027397 [Rehmannia glutinosa]|uniref:Uncharacterized protein n=1 Tax=Rehmannia glutinosa TaxID=99300 RepID=A0ABR0VW56_REHGL
MDQRERKEHPSLPPDYVSLAQLQERWLRKQKEKELKEKQEKEKIERDAATQNENQNRKGFKNEKEKELKEKQEKEKKERDAATQNENQNRKGFKNDGRGDGSEEVKIVPQNEVKVGNQSGINGGLKGINEIASVNRRDFRGGFRRNGDNQGSGYKSKKENRVRLNQLKETEVRFAVDKKGYSKEWRQRRRNDNNGECCYKLNENEPDVLKGNVVEPESEKKAEDSNLEICSEKGGFNGRDRNKTKEHRVERKGLNDNIAALEKKVDEEVLVVESSKNGEKGGIGNGYRRYGNSRGNNGRRSGDLNSRDWKQGHMRSRVDANVGDRFRYTRSGRFEDRRSMKQRESGMMWVKKEEKLGDAAAAEDRYISYGLYLEMSINLMKEKATVIQTLLFVSGLNTLLHSFFGTRLPSVIGGSYAFLIPATSIIHARRYRMIDLPEQRKCWSASTDKSRE